MTWVCTSTRRAAGTARSSSTVVTSSACMTARVVPAACSGSTPRSIGPLWMIARWNSPAAAGMPSRTLTLAPPPDSPKIVTLPGSPPKAAMLSRTHSSASTMSSAPGEPEAATSAP